MLPSKTIDHDTAETTLPGACVVCAGDVELKVTGRRAVTYCKTCHWFGKPEVSVTFNGLKVQYQPSAWA